MSSAASHDRGDSLRGTPAKGSELAIPEAQLTRRAIRSDDFSEVA
jgi:hypothetical protein